MVQSSGNGFVAQPGQVENMNTGVQRPFGARIPVSQHMQQPQGMGVMQDQKNRFMQGMPQQQTLPQRGLYGGAIQPSPSWQGQQTPGGMTPWGMQARQMPGMSMRQPMPQATQNAAQQSIFGPVSDRYNIPPPSANPWQPTPGLGNLQGPGGGGGGGGGGGFGSPLGGGFSQNPNSLGFGRLPAVLPGGRTLADTK